MTKLHYPRLARIIVALALAIVLCQVPVAHVLAAGAGTIEEPVRTDSPRDTFETFLSLRGEFESTLLDYRKERTRSNRRRIGRVGEKLLSLIDLSEIPEVSRRETGIKTGGFLLDILGRVELPPAAQVPAAEAFYDKTGKSARWRIPHTPLEIVRMNSGPREGEFLFSAQTVITAPHFYQDIRNLPLRSPLGIASWSEMLPQLTGPAIPAGLVAMIPAALKKTWLDTAVWKVFGTFLLTVAAIGFVVAWSRVVSLVKAEAELWLLFRRLLIPVMSVLVIAGLWTFLTFQVNIAGRFAAIYGSAATLAVYLAAVWTYWLLVLIIVDLIVRSPKIPDQSLDASLLRLCARLVGIFGGVAILAYAASTLGLPVFSVLAGLGIGGLAVALAIRPTLENLIGGLILYADRPVRVGDFCQFGNYIGIIESIGVRSTKLRALDRTLISVPNAKLADMEIINWAQCDQMLITATIGLRYETGADQLRYVLATLREMLYAHPKIDSETVRVRFEGYGASSLDVNIRVYALTREWNDFYAIREDVLLRISEIVDKSGSGFAFPSQTLYVRRDEGLDDKRSKAAADQVAAWRKSGHLPFPSAPPTRVNELAGTLDYPPRGSPDASAEAPLEAASPERLSASPDAEEGGRAAAEEETAKPSQPGPGPT